MVSLRSLIPFARSSSIFWKVFGAVGITVLLVVVFQFFYFPAKQIEVLEVALTRKIESLGAVMTDSFASALDFMDIVSAEQGLENLTADADFAYAVLFDADEVPLAVQGIELLDAEKLDAGWQEEPTTVFEGELLRLKQPISSMAGTRGMLVIALKISSITQGGRVIRFTTLFVGLVIMALTSLIALFLGRLIGRNLQTMANVAEKVAHGDLSHPPLEEVSTDEVGRLASSFNRMLASQRDLVKQITDTAEQITFASTEFIATAQEQEHGAREQSATIEEIVASMTALSTTIGDTATNVDELSSVAEDMSVNATSGQNALDTAQQAMGQIVTQNELIVGRIDGLYEKSQAIISVVDIIDDISDRLDLLALNAALEGSRVGEAGKGFSLVAQEMRRLAENVVNSTKEIKETIQEMHRYVQAALEASKEGEGTTREGVDQMNKMSEVISKIFSLIETSTVSARSITLNTQQQLSSTEQVVQAMTQVAGVSSQGLISAQAVTQGAGDMTNLAERLREQVRVYRIDRQSPQIGDA